MAALEKLLIFTNFLPQIKLSSGALKNVEKIKMKINIKTIYNTGGFTKKKVLKNIIEGKI